MKLTIFILFMLSVTCINAQRFRLSVGDNSYSIENILSITPDSVGVTPDSSSVFYDIRLRVNVPRRIVELDTTISRIKLDSIPYVRKDVLIDQLISSIANITTLFAESQFNAYYRDSTYNKMNIFNPLITSLTGNNYFTNSFTKWGDSFVGYWRMIYDNGAGVKTTKYFRIGSNASIIEIKAGANNTVVPVPAGYDGTLRVYGPRMIDLKDLLPGVTTLLMSCSADDNKIFVARETRFADGVNKAFIQFSYLPAKFQARTYVP